MFPRILIYSRETFSPKSAKFDTFFPIFFQILPLNLQIFAIFPPKYANLDNFFPTKCNFEKFSTSESQKYGESFSQFFGDWGNNNFFWHNIHL